MIGDPVTLTWHLRNVRITQIYVALEKNRICRWECKLGNYSSQRIYPWYHVNASVNWVSIGSDNGFSSSRRQANIRSNAGVLLTGPLGINFSESFIEINIFSLKTIHLKCRQRNGSHFMEGVMSKRLLLLSKDHLKKIGSNPPWEIKKIVVASFRIYSAPAIKLIFLITFVDN